MLERLFARGRGAGPAKTATCRGGTTGSPTLACTGAEKGGELKGLLIFAGAAVSSSRVSSKQPWHRTTVVPGTG